MNDLRSLVAGNMKFMARRIVQDVAGKAKNKDAAIEGELYLYDVIGKDFFGGIGAQDVVDALKEMGKVKTLNLFINSPGGDVFEGEAIYNVIKRKCDNVNVFVDGLAASAASFIAMAGTTITMSPGSMMMIHNPWGMAIGEAEDMRKTADMLDKVRGTIVDIYVKRTGCDPEDCKQWMDDETWMTAKEAKEKGFCDVITDEEDEEEETGDHSKRSAKNIQPHTILAKYKHTPATLREQSLSVKTKMSEMSMYVSKLKMTRASPDSAKASRSATK